MFILGFTGAIETLAADQVPQAPPSRRGTGGDTPPGNTAFRPGAEKIVDYVDPTYGGKIRQLQKDDGHEHNFYYCREPWNADASYLLGIQSDLQQKNWHVVLPAGSGTEIFQPMAN